MKDDSSIIRFCYSPEWAVRLRELLSPLGVSHTSKQHKEHIWTTITGASG